MQKTPSVQHRTKLSGCIFATKARSAIGKKKLVNKKYLLRMSSQYGERRPTNS